MNKPVLVQVIATPVACATGVTDRWREASTWVAQNLVARFGDAIRFEYWDLFDAECPPLPEGAQLPLVLVNGQALSNIGGKLSAVVIRKEVERLLSAS